MNRYPLVFHLPLIVLACLSLASPAQARLTKLIVDKTSVVDIPSFGATGAYEKISGTFEGELDPANPRDAVIADLALAPRVDGKVHYSSTFYILRPRDPAKGNGKLFYMTGNRGKKMELRLDDALDSNDPTTAADFGNGWLNRQGYILAWNGWDGNATPGTDVMSIQLPMPANPDGSSVTGLIAAELLPMKATEATFTLPYPTNLADKSNGVLTVREHEADPKVVTAAWHYAGDRQVTLDEAPKPEWIYEFVYTAKNPKLMGVGHAASRDFIEFLKFGVMDDVGTPNPAAVPGGIKAVYSFGRSQGGRVQRDFLYLGFNEDEAGTHKRLIDGMIPYAASADQMWTNYRFAQPSVSVLQHLNHHGLGAAEGPHTIPVVTDTLTGKTDGVLKSCTERGVCPKIMVIESANEYWNKSSSLNHTDAKGADLDIAKLAPDLRIYFVASMQHSVAYKEKAVPLDLCQGLSNPLYQGQMFRALIADLDGWVTRGTLPPSSSIPTRKDGSLVSPFAVKFPKIPGVQFSPASMGSDGVLDISHVPFTDLPGKRYVVQVPQVDADGNDVAGVRLPFIAVPLGTHNGWNLLKPGMGGPDLCMQNGQYVPFAKTKAERLAAGDPRPSVEERYGTLEAYEARLKAAIEGLIKQRLLLAEDESSLMAEGRDLALAAGLKAK